MYRRTTYPQLGPEGGPGVLGPWRELRRPETASDGRRARVRETVVGIVARVRAAFGAPLS